MDLDPSTLSGRDRYRLFVSAVVPRPIALISSISAEGAVNVAPFSYFSLVSTSPPIVSISIGQRTWDGERIDKDTAANIKSVGEFVVNIAGESLAEQLNASSAELPPGESEARAVGFATAPSIQVTPPRVTDCAVQLECRRVELLSPAPGLTLVLGEAVHVHVEDAAWDAERGDIDPERLRPLSRLGRTFYGTIGGILDLPRPK